jgi:hypothetical protein
MIIEAFQYASLGYKVFPCLPGSKKPMTEHGFHDATTDPEQIRAWWEKAPDANVAIATEGLLVIDKDGADNPWMRDQPDRLQSLEAAPRARTPRGGEHIVFRQPPGARVSCSAGSGWGEHRRACERGVPPCCALGREEQALRVAGR